MGRPKLLANPIPDEMRLPAGDEPCTIQRLRSLRPGQVYRFYTGAEVDCESKEPPLTAALLQRIFEVVYELEERGQIVVRQVKIGTRSDDQPSAQRFSNTRPSALPIEGSK